MKPCSVKKSQATSADTEQTTTLQSVFRLSCVEWTLSLSVANIQDLLHYKKECITTKNPQAIANRMPRVRLDI